jgi:hypothetical protein
MGHKAGVLGGPIVRGLSRNGLARLSATPLNVFNIFKSISI